MSENLPERVAASIPAVIPDLADARRAFHQAAHSDDPWTRAEAAAAVWLREPRFSDGTRDQYRRVWDSWRAWCHLSGTSPFEAERMDVNAYIEHLRDHGNPASERPRPLRNASILRHMAALASFYIAAIEDEKTDRNPVPSKRPTSKRESRQPHLEPVQLGALVNAADKDGPRTSALVALLVMACLRVSEAVNARIEDLSWDGDVVYLLVTRKGDKDDWTLLTPDVWERVSAAIGGRQHGYILAGPREGRLDRSDAWEIVKSIGKRAGIKSPIGPHTLRHAYITRGYELKQPVANLQIAAAHANVDTTRGYDRRKRLPVADHPSTAIVPDILKHAAKLRGGTGGCTE